MDAIYDEFFEAAKVGNVTILNNTIQCPEIDINILDYVYRSALFYASLEDHSRIVELLLSHENILLNNKDKMYRVTPLGIASYKGNSEVVKLLLEHPQIDINGGD